MYNKNKIKCKLIVISKEILIMSTKVNMYSYEVNQKKL